MSFEVYWFLPSSGDSRYLGQSKYGRVVNIDYLSQIAVAADTLGYDGILIPTGVGCEDPWVTASAQRGQVFSSFSIDTIPTFEKPMTLNISVHYHAS